ncbi:DsbA family oxidoreductase [Proteus vulgaris]|uniref:DsbA family oxidoreductase n=1 Tax=Morganellaceae TaxID=1903414 RepID=UPI0018C5D3F2|nr:DsbA family oxidoreductase [Proteus vulgaris]MBG5975834.1 DsbA family oxidoreductase [Proteus mirabilis]MBQ0213901.1 DsbA family oxidoreductase [Proteus vulgaris]
MKSLMPRISVDVWSDYVCPWCWIAKKRFEKSLEEFEHSKQVDVHHHSYRIASDHPPIPFRSALYQKFGGEHAAELMMNQIESTGKSEGLIYNFDTMLFGDTREAHALAAAARESGLGDQMSERLFFAATTEGRSIFDRNELIALAVEVGMTKPLAEIALENPVFRSSVDDDEAKARAIGANGVPLFVINNKYAISGAQSAANFLNTLRQVWEETKDESMFMEGQVCGIDSCK